MADIRVDLENVAAHVGTMTTEQMDRIAAAVRDSLVARGLDPADRATLEVALVVSHQSLCHAVNGMAGTLAVSMLWAQAETFRKWLDGETPIVSAADMLHLSGLE